MRYDRDERLVELHCNKYRYLCLEAVVASAFAETMVGVAMTTLNGLYAVANRDDACTLAADAQFCQKLASTSTCWAPNMAAPGASGRTNPEI